MYCDIITIGDELLIGQVHDTNSTWMAQNMNMIGSHVRRKITVADDEKEIIQSLGESLKHVDVVLLTGGLGPTRDDLTKDALCKYFQTGLVINEEAHTNLLEFYKRRNRSLPEISKMQAYVPDACTPLQNKWGTAPGMWFDVVEDGKEKIKSVISMPGVPSEMKGMMESYVLPKLKERNQNHSIFHKTILTHGVGETYLAEKIKDWEDRLPNDIKLAYLPAFGNVRLRLSSHGDDMNLTKNRVMIQVKELEKLISEHVFGYDEDSVEKIVHRLLKEKNCSLSTAESCTAGAIASAVVSIPGSSVFFKGSVIAYANEIKSGMLNVDQAIIKKHGAVSEEVASAMAENVRKLMKTDFSIATSGIAGPDGGTEEKPVGTVCIAIASPQGTICKTMRFTKNRIVNIQLFTDAALQLLRKEIIRYAP